MYKEINMLQLQKDIISYIGYFVECFQNHDLGMINVRIFNVSDSDMNAIEDKIFDYEERFLKEHGCVLIPLVKSKLETQNNYSYLLPIIEEFENQNNLKCSSLEKFLSGVSNNTFSNILDFYSNQEIVGLNNNTNKNPLPFAA